LVRPSRAEAPPPRYARPFVAVFLTALVVCAVAAVNLWPFSNWELFSRLRTDQQTGWGAVAIDRTEGERIYPIAELAHGYRGFGFIVAHFTDRSAKQRDAICAVWLRGATARYGSSTREVRIDHLSWLLSDRQGKRAAPPHRTAAWICSAEGAREVG
jgi:hypothetical protein